MALVAVAYFGGRFDTVPLNASLALLALDRESRRALADAMPVMVMVADSDGVVAFFNKYWHEYTGQAPFDRDTGSSWQRYIHPDDRVRISQEWMNAVRSGETVVELQYRIKSVSGEYRWFHSKAIALQDESGKVQQWIGVAMEIEQERRKQAELASLYADVKSVAIHLQRASLPPSLPEVDGLRFDTLYAPNLSTMAICGDWYDAFALPDGSVGISVGDVTGHGVEAAVLMGKMRYSLRAITFRAVASQSGEPDAILQSVEEAFQTEHPAESTTAFLGIISADRNVIRYSCAGHPPPLAIRRTGEAVWLDEGDPPIGFSLGTTRRSYVADLTAVSHLLLYTDGLVEAGRNIVAGLERLESVAKKLCRPSATLILDDVVTGR